MMPCITTSTTITLPVATLMHAASQHPWEHFLPAWHPLGLSLHQLWADCSMQVMLVLVLLLAQVQAACGIVLPQLTTVAPFSKQH